MLAMTKEINLVKEWGDFKIPHSFFVLYNLIKESENFIKNQFLKGNLIYAVI